MLLGPTGPRKKSASSPPQNSQSFFEIIEGQTKYSLSSLTMSDGFIGWASPRILLSGGENLCFSGDSSRYPSGNITTNGEVRDGRASTQERHIIPSQTEKRLPVNGNTFDLWSRTYDFGLRKWYDKLSTGLDIFSLLGHYFILEVPSKE